MHTFVIAELGINHNGCLDIARQLIDVAKVAGCDAVKFQKRDIDTVYKQEFLAMDRESPWGTTQRAQKEGLEFGCDEYDEIDIYCKRVGIPWFASAWDVPSQMFLRRYDLKYNKIASAMIVHEKLLGWVAAEGLHTFISTGMSSMNDIAKAVEIFRQAKCSFELMHCVSTYPMKIEHANLTIIETLRKRFGCHVGYSGHEVGLIVAEVATVLGATSIERHITLDRAMYGSDQAASVEPGGLIKLVRDIRIIEKVMGDGEKRMLEVEKPIAEKLRAHIGR